MLEDAARPTCCRRVAVWMSHRNSCEDRPPDASTPAAGAAASVVTWSVCSSSTKDACVPKKYYIVET